MAVCAVLGTAHHESIISTATAAHGVWFSHAHLFYCLTTLPPYHALDLKRQVLFYFYVQALPFQRPGSPGMDEGSSWKSGHHRSEQMQVCQQPVYSKLMSSHYTYVRMAKQPLSYATLY